MTKNGNRQNCHRHINNACHSCVFCEGFFCARTAYSVTWWKWGDPWSVGLSQGDWRSPDVRKKTICSSPLDLCQLTSHLWHFLGCVEIQCLKSETGCLTACKSPWWSCCTLVAKLRRTAENAAAATRFPSPHSSVTFAEFHRNPDNSEWRSIPVEPLWRWSCVQCRSRTSERPCRENKTCSTDSAAESPASTPRWSTASYQTGTTWNTQNAILYVKFHQALIFPNQRNTVFGKGKAAASEIWKKEEVLTVKAKCVAKIHILS